MLKHRYSFNRHKLYRTFPKNKDDVKFLDNLLKSGEDGVSNKPQNLRVCVSLILACRANNEDLLSC